MDIAHYTYQQWGEEVFEQYRQGLKDTFEKIGRGNTILRSLSKNMPSVFYTKYRFHFIFFVKNEDGEPVIIAVIHEKRDIATLLNQRMGE